MTPNIVFSAAFAALSITTAAHAERVVTAKLASFPEKGQVARASAGDEFFSYSRIYATEGAVLGERAKAGNWLLEQWYEAGTKLVPVDTRVAFKACVPDPGTLESYNGACFLDDDGDGTFDRHAADFATMARKLKTKVTYRREPIAIQNDDSFKYVLLYQGATSDTVRFSYREFKNDLARAAFTEELTVPREAFPMVLRLKDHTFEITGINGLGVSYRLID